MKRSIVQHRGSHDRAKLATPGAFNASMNPPKSMLITIIEIWLRNAGSSMPAISDKDETGEKRPSTKSTDRYVRVDRYLAAKAWRLADPESGETNGREKQRDESDGSEITALPPRERERCVGSPWILIIKGGIFSTIRRFIYPTNLRNELNTGTRLLIIIG